MARRSSPGSPGPSKLLSAIFCCSAKNPWALPDCRPWAMVSPITSTKGLTLMAGALTASSRSWCCHRAAVRERHGMGSLSTAGELMGCQPIGQPGVRTRLSKAGSITLSDRTSRAPARLREKGIGRSRAFRPARKSSPAWPWPADGLGLFTRSAADADFHPARMPNGIRMRHLTALGTLEQIRCWS